MLYNTLHRLKDPSLFSLSGNTRADISKSVILRNWLCDTGIRCIEYSNTGMNRAVYIARAFRGRSEPINPIDNSSPTLRLAACILAVVFVLRIPVHPISTPK